MKLKNPLVLDVSHWEIIKNFSAINPRPALIITKATESLMNVDAKFVEYFDGMKKNNIFRGCFHFFRKAYDAVAQAKHFVNTIKPHLNETDIIALDIEEGGETAKQIIQFCDFVQSAFPKNIFLIYSRKSILDLVVMTQAQKIRLRSIPVWTAGYPTFPDLLATPPLWYKPNRDRWGQVVLWQYSDGGVVEGVEGKVDVNWIDPEFLKSLGIATPNEVPQPVPVDVINSGNFQMTTIGGGTRIRSDHNVYAGVLTSVGRGVVVTGNETWTAPLNGNNVKAGDKWLKVTYAGITGWMALTHMGVPICKDFKTVDILSSNSSKDTGLHVPTEGTFYQVMHDWQVVGSGGLPLQRQGGHKQPNDPMPNMRVMWGQRPNDFMPMTKEWQFWLLDLLDWASDGKLPRGEFEYFYTRRAEQQTTKITKTTLPQIDSRVKYTDGSLIFAYEDLISNHRAFTDNNAPESGFADYVTGRNLQAKPYSWKSLHSPGNIVKVLGVWQQNPKYYIIEALDLTKPPPTVEWVVANKPYLIGWATEQTVVKLPDKRWQVSKFPQLKLAQRVWGLPECGTPFPVIGNGTNLMLKTDLKPIQSGASYSPYVPEK